MRIAIMGAGAVGGFFGAKLAAACHDVAFLARGKHLEVMRSAGLRLNSPEGAVHVRSSLFTSDPAEIGPVDLVLFCVKSYDTEQTSAQLGPLIGDRTLILSLQNGVDNADKIASMWGRRTLAGVVYLAAQLAQPGVVQHTGGGRIVFGDLEGGISETAKGLEQTLSSANVACAASSDIRQAMWTKLAWNAAFCAIACLTRGTVRDILDSESLRKLVADCVAEVREAAMSQGLELSTSLLDDIWSFSKTLGDFKPSMLQDLESGKPIEYEALNGIVVKTLGRVGKNAPVNQIFYGTLKSLDQKVRARRQTSPL